MSDTPVNNRKLILQPTNTPKIDIGESNLFSKQVDINLWEAAAQKIIPEKMEKNRIKHEIFKVNREAKQYEEILYKKPENKLDFSC